MNKLNDIHEDIVYIKQDIEKILILVNSHEGFLNQIKGGLKVIGGSGLILVVYEIIKTVVS